MIKETVRQYLEKYAGIRRRIEGTPPSPVDIAIIIPIKNEFPGICDTIESLNSCEVPVEISVLVIGIVNNSDDDAQEIRENNLRSLQFFSELSDTKSITYRVIDASTRENALPAKSAGVGLARKTGMDEALNYLKDPEKGILVCLDADCTVNKQYINAIRTAFSASSVYAAVTMFAHRLKGLDEIHTRAILLYEIYIRLYACGIKAAGSPYGYLPVGSTMMCTGEYYIKAEGMNKRKAAEDFYFLEKLSKITPIHTIQDAIVYPSARISRRVPFGTGPAIDDILAGKRDAEKIYNPAIFVLIARWLKAFYTEEALSPDLYLNAAREIHPAVFSYLSSPAIIKEMENLLKNTKSGKTLLRQKIRWFDALKTLRMIHTIRDEAIPDIPAEKAIQNFAAMIGANLPLLSGNSNHRLKQLCDWLREIHNKEILFGQNSDTMPK